MNLLLSFPFPQSITGLFIAHLNKANVLEIQGYMQLAKESFVHSLSYADAQVSHDLFIGLTIMYTESSLLSHSDP